jgi:hypothetical protein
MIELTGIRPTAIVARSVVAVILLALTANQAGWSQQPGQEPEPPAAAPAPRENPGLINELGKLIGDPAALLPNFKRAPEPAAEPETPAAPAPAVEAPSPPVAEPPSRSMIPSLVSGRVACPLSGNGAPDCKLASDRLCQSRGYIEGKSLATDSSEKCSAKRLIPGRPHQPDDCKTESFVTRAWCQ